MARGRPLIQINVPWRTTWFCGDNESKAGQDMRITRFMRIIGPGLAAVLALGACVTPRQTGAMTGAARYADHCAACHGPGGRGDGVLAAGLPVSPADLTALSARNGGVFPWSMVMARVHGYAGRAGEMPEFGTILTGPMVSWSDETGTPVETPAGLLAIARYLETIQA